MKTGKERRDQERERTETMARILAEYLTEHKAWNWNWPSDGTDGLHCNCWPTNNPKPKYPKAPGDEHVVEGPQTYYSKHLKPKTGKRWQRRQSRRKSPRLLRAGLKFGRAHSYPGKTEGGF